jgi:hypothetical protein
VSKQELRKSLELVSSLVQRFPILLGKYPILGSDPTLINSNSNSTWRSSSYLSSFYLNGQTSYPVNGTYLLGQGMRACSQLFNQSADPFGTPAKLFNAEWKTVVFGILNPSQSVTFKRSFDQRNFPHQYSKSERIWVISKHFDSNFKLRGKRY